MTSLSFKLIVYVVIASSCCNWCYAFTLSKMFGYVKFGDSYPPLGKRVDTKARSGLKDNQNPCNEDEKLIYDSKEDRLYETNEAPEDDIGEFCLVDPATGKEILLTRVQLIIIHLLEPEN